MSADFEKLFNDFDRGRISRRQLLVALGVAMAVRPGRVLAQGQCSGARAGSPDCDTTPAKLPFESTGWKTVLLDHFSCQVADYPKEAAYYDALMSWKIRSDDGKQALLDIGDWGGIILRGGYVPPPPPPAPPAAPEAPAPPPAGSDAAAARAGTPGRGGFAGRGQGGGRGGGRGPRAPRLAVVDGFCWGIEPWNAKKVEAALKARGLDPIADNQGKDFESFHVKDPDGFNLQINNGNRKNRHRGAPNAKTSAPAPFDATNWKTIWLDHISFEVSNYKETVAFYTALLGWTPGKDEGSQNQCRIGDVGDVIIRRNSRIGQAAPTERHANIGHIAFGITPWDVDQVKAELEKRGLTARPDSGLCPDIHTAAYQSYHTTTPNGFDLQISNASHDRRDAAAQCS